MATPFFRNTAISAGVHGALAVMLVVVSLVAACRSRRPEKDIFLIDTTTGAVLAPGGAPPTPVPTAAPAVKPTAKPPEKIKDKDDIPDKRLTPTPAPRPTVQVNTNIVRRMPTPVARPTVSPRDLTREIRAALNQVHTGPVVGAPAPTTRTDGPRSAGLAGGPGGGGYSPFGAYYAAIKETMYNAWNPPGAVGGKDYLTQAEIRVQRDGRISERRLIRKSGNAVYDQSVLDAVNSVAKLDPLPAGLGADYKDITIDFTPQE